MAPPPRALRAPRSSNAKWWGLVHGPTLGKGNCPSVTAHVWSHRQVHWLNVHFSKLQSLYFCSAELTCPIRWSSAVSRRQASSDAEAQAASGTSYGTVRRPRSPAPRPPQFHFTRPRVDLVSCVWSLSSWLLVSRCLLPSSASRPGHVALAARRRAACLCPADRRRVCPCSARRSQA